MTSGVLACPRCANPVQPEEIGYQPLYRDIDGKPVMVIVHGYSREKVDALRFRQFVSVSRGLEQSDPVMVSEVAGKQAWYSSTLAARQKPADLTETLLRIWGIPELVSWYRSTSDNAMSLAPGVAVREDGTAHSPELQAAAKRAGAKVVTTGPAVDEYHVILGRVRDKLAAEEVLKNGKPK